MLGFNNERKIDELYFLTLCSALIFLDNKCVVVYNTSIILTVRKTLKYNSNLDEDILCIVQ